MSRENLTVLGVVAMIVMGSFLVAHMIHQEEIRQNTVYDVSVRSLAADPEFYKGKKVRVSFDGLEDGPDSLTLTFRSRTDRPVLVEFHFPVVPDHRNGKFVGFCAGRDGEKVLVVDCKVVK